MDAEFKEEILTSECKLFSVSTTKNILSLCILARTLEVLILRLFSLLEIIL